MTSLIRLLKTATGVTCHSEHVSPGNIFVAIRGRSQNGNQFAYQAASKGAIAIISDAPESLNILGVPVIFVPDARIACAWLAAEYYQHPSRELSLVGVTGTNGKTTIATMLRQIYQTSGFCSGLIGTVNVEIGDYSLPSKLTTPDSLSLQHYLRVMCNQHVSHAAMEVSAQGMELNRVDHVQFSCGILSNVCPDHLDFHGDYASYVRAKQLFPNLLSGSPLIANAADPVCLAIARSYGGPVITAGVNTPANISAYVLRANQNGSVFQLVIDQNIARKIDCQHTEQRFYLRIPGLHNVENALLASGAALAQGISLQTIARAIANFSGVERRFKVYSYSGCTVIDDTALNPGSIDAVFQTVRQFRYNRLVVINAIRGCRGPAINAANAQSLARWQEKMPFTMIITASHDQTEFSDRVTQQEKLAFLSELDYAQANYLYIESLRDAIIESREVTQPGDLLLLIGAQGMDQGSVVLASVSQPTPVDLPVARPNQSELLSIHSQ